MRFPCVSESLRLSLFSSSLFLSLLALLDISARLLLLVVVSLKSLSKAWLTLAPLSTLPRAGVIGTWGRRRSGYVGEKGTGFLQPKREDHIKKGKGYGLRNVYRNFFWRPLY